MMRRVTSLALACLFGLLVAAAAAGPRELMDRDNRFLDKPWPKAELTPAVVMADAFEDADAVTKGWAGDRATFELSDQHATEGKHSLKVTFEKAGNAFGTLRHRRGTSGWGNTVPGDVEVLGLRALHYDELRLDVFNPGEPLKLVLTFAAEKQRLEIDLKSGANSLVIPTADMRKEVYRVSEIPGTLTFSIADMKESRTLYFDNMRWVGRGLGKNLIEHAKCFDFGQPFAVRPFFHGVHATTGHTKERGFGWEKPTTVPPQQFPPVTATHLTARRPDDELLWDYISSAKSAFLVDLPAGKYRLQLVEHGIGFYDQRPCMFDLSVKIGDGPAQVIRKGAATYAQVMEYEYGLDQFDWQPGCDLWKAYRGHLIRPLELDFEHAGGTCKLDIATTPRGHENFSFLIIYPIDKAEAIEPELAALWQDLRYRFLEAFAPATRAQAAKMRLPGGLHEEYLDPQARQRRLAELSPTDAEKQRGLVTFCRGGVDEVYPDTVPARAECGDSLTAFAPVGEMASFAPCVYALKGLKSVRLDVGDFAGPGGAKIPAAAVDVRVVNCIPRMTGQQSHGDWRYTIMPWHLVKRPAVDIAADSSRRWWINVDVPADAPAGTYTATAKLSGEGLAAVPLKLTIDVPPFKLDPLPKDVEQAMAVPLKQWGELADWRTIFFIRTWVIYRDLSRFDKPDLGRWKPLYEGAMKSLEGRFDAEFSLMRRCGLNHVYSATFRPEQVGMPAATRPTEGIGVTWFGVEAGPAMEKQLASTRHFMYSRAILKDFTQEAVAQRAKDKGVPVTLSMNADPFQWTDAQQEAGTYRFVAGFFLWRVGAAGGLYGPWNMAWRDPYNPTDGHVSEWGDFAVPASTGEQPAFNPTMILEGLREGIADYRYVAMVERLAREKTGTTAAKDATASLSSLRESIQPEAAKYFDLVGARGGWDNTWVQKPSAPKGKDYDQRRRELARHVAALLAEK